MTGDELARLRSALAESGLNVLGVADVAEYDSAVPRELRSDELAPNARAIIVVGSGGPLLWEAFIAALRAEPKRLSGEAHPLDAFVEREVIEADAVLGSLERRWFFAAATAKPSLDFRLLGQLAGLGSRSRLGLLLNPEYGPWLGLRAACFVNASLKPSPRARELCAACAAPCVVSCAGDAMTTGIFNLTACVRFHQVSDACERTCHTRAACPIGAQHRYSAEEITYHYHRRAGRLHLRTITGVNDDVLEGDAPFWRLSAE